jgi:ElaB/YqjD/DUF883 family membrane-anchored ribosome-binding protein
VAGAFFGIFIALIPDACDKGTTRERIFMEYNERDNIHEIGSEAREIGSEAERKSERVSERASAAAQRTAEKVGSQMKNFAGRIRDTGPRVESRIHNTAERLAEKLERGSAYFTERQYEGTTRKITDYIRQHPGTSMMVGLAAGLLLALKRRQH